MILRARLSVLCYGIAVTKVSKIFSMVLKRSLYCLLMENLFFLTSDKSPLKLSLNPNTGFSFALLNC